MKHGTYVGTDPMLEGQAALIRDNDKPGAKKRSILAQFDDIQHLPMEYTHGWTSFYASEFKYDPPFEE